MDEDGILSSANILTQDSEICFDHLTTRDVDSSSEFNNDSTETKNTRSHKIVSNNSLSHQFSASLTDLNTLEADMVNKETNKELTNEDLENSHDYNLNNEEHKNQVFPPNTEFKSANNNNEQNINMGLKDDFAASNTIIQISTAKDLEICLDDKEETVFNRKNENPEIQSVSESNSEIVSDEQNIVEIVPENINAEGTYEAKQNLNVLDLFLPRLSDNNEEQTILNCDGEIGETGLQGLPVLDKNSTQVENKVEKDESLMVDVQNVHSSDHLIRSKSVAELSTVRTSKPNSLAEDAKLVKFSVSAKSVNIMQSNAQFLNKSRNFLNFITEKSTNIMEKTLLPQNLASRYNSILRMTENNSAIHKKCIEDTASSSNVAGIHPSLKSDSGLGQNTDNANVHNREKQDESVSENRNDHEDPMREDQKLFLKCSVNEDKSINDFTPKKQETETESTNAFPITNSENSHPSSDIAIPNIIKDKISNFDLNGTEEDQSLIRSNSSNSNSSDKIITAVPKESSELLCRDSSSSNVIIDERNLVKENKTDDVVASCTTESNAKISPSSRRVSVEHSDRQLIKGDENGSKDLNGEPIDLELLSHPAYIALLRDYSNLKEKSEKLSEAGVKIEMENQRLAAENNRELHALQLETLEKTIEQLRHDLKQATASQELMNKEYLLANKERESMVMKYAISEKQLIDTQRAREYAERKVNEALKEQELLHTKLKQVQGERTRICNILDGKCHELTDAQKEIDRLKEELSMREVKLKWTQNKLKAELETQKENQQKLDKAMLRINEMKEECEQVKKESHEMIRKFQQSEENKVVNLDHQLKEQQARLILERHVTEDKELSRLQLQKEVDTLKQRQHTLIEENNMLSLKVQNLEKERLNYENNLSNLKVIADQRQKEVVDLVGKVSQLETLKLQLQHKEQLLSSNEAEVERLRQSNTELQSDMEWCREREAHMLEFTQKLTDKNVRLQSEFTSMEAKNEQLELEQGPLHDQIKELSSKVKALEISLASEKSKRTEECELLARHVAEQTQLARNLAQKLEDSQGENAVLRRKQQISVKEMTKELQQCKKRLDAFETGSPSNSLDRTSRTGSSSSLSTGETLNGAVSDNSNSGDNVLHTVEPDRQTLIDRIVKLQKIRVRQAEKLDFLEEHTRTLVNELQKKSKIIKNYILHENPDAMGSNERDRNKAELARHGGIMASVYNQRVSDDNMTLELSLEMNQKLQAVLEDTLLKNITLKDSIDTLGGEIARLTMQTKRKQ